MGRRAVAATIASVVIFTSMLLANAVLFSAENSYLGSSSSSSAQLQERTYASVLAGIMSYSSLADAQSFLQSTPMDCSSSASYLASLAGSRAIGGDNQSIWFTATSSWYYSPVSSSLFGDALLPAQFNGYSDDGLDIHVITTVNETLAGGLPSYSTQFSQVVHLSAPVQLVASQCISLLSELSRSLLAIGSCNSSAVAQAVSSVQAGSAGPDAFQVGASVGPVAAGGSPTAPPHCVIDYWVRTTLTGQGVSGAFQWTVFGLGSLST
jgi:hypothetical protein